MSDKMLFGIIGFVMTISFLAYKAKDDDEIEEFDLSLIRPKRGTVAPVIQRGNDPLGYDSQLGIYSSYGP